MKRVAIVILNWNGKKFLQEFLPSIIEYSKIPDSEIIVADNNSGDGSVEYVAQKHPDIRIIRFDKNYGFAEGYSKALPQIESEYFVLLNTDVQVTPGWLSPLIDSMEQNENIAACMPRIRSFHQKDSFEYAGAAGGFIDTFGYPFCRGRILGYIEKDSGQYDNKIKVFWASGACLVIRKSVYLHTGGFDGIFFAHMEEIDLCWRIHRLGYEICCVPQSVVYHVGGGSLPNDNPRKIYLNYRNNLYLLFKNLPAGRLFPVLFVRILMDILSAIVYLIQGKGWFFAAVIRAHLAFYRDVPLLCKKRKLNKSTAGKSNVYGIYHGSIVFDYFFRSKRTFSQLKCKW